MSLIQTFFYPKSDFFSPEIDTFTDLCVSKPVKHLISGEQTEQVQAINTLALLRSQCVEWPEWQRYDGSIIYEALPESFKEKFKPEYLDENGYVDVEGLYIFEEETLKTLSETQRQSAGRKPNACPFTRQRIDLFVTCPALSIRLSEGLEFKPEQHQQVLGNTAPCLHLKKGGDDSLQYRKIEDVLSCNEAELNRCASLTPVRFQEMKQEVRALKKLWKYVKSQEKPPLSPNRSFSITQSVSAVSTIGVLALLQIRANIALKLWQRISNLYLGMQVPHLAIR